ncbi:MAG: nuclear transport factor 2 family protein [Oceanospirillaceae bacterium]|nr:nuclear transport factor 2 family protein [Oceanospirillaceae bacterium]NRB42753.1 nuclear transport factor 2 family protein [Pseudomonadales bacterium]
MNNTTLTTALYAAVDNKNIEGLAVFIAKDVHFCLGNFAPITGRDAVLEANRAFFSSINSMRHRLDNIWQCGEQVICNGTVEYVRIDNSEYSVPFATVLKFSQGKIIEYFVYVDISKL